MKKRRERIILIHEVNEQIHILECVGDDLILIAILLSSSKGGGFLLFAAPCGIKLTMMMIVIMYYLDHPDIAITASC